MQIVRIQNGKDWETNEQDNGRNEENDEGQKRMEKMDLWSHHYTIWQKGKRRKRKKKKKKKKEENL